MTLIPASRIREVHGLTPDQTASIRAFLQGAIYTWCNNRGEEWFAACDLVGNNARDWEGTPLIVLFGRYAEQDRADAIIQARIDLGWLLKGTLHGDIRFFEASRDGMPNRYRWHRPTVIDELVLLGRIGVDGIPPSLENEDVAWAILGSQEWLEEAQQRSLDDVACLIRGLILYARKSGRNGFGSVSPVIQLHRYVVEQNYESEPVLTSWIVDNRTNPYEPFGVMYDHGARTHTEFRTRRAASEQQGRENALAEYERYSEQRALRKAREEIEATQRLANAVRRGDLLAVQALLRKGADVTKALPNGESIVAFARIHGREPIAIFFQEQGIA